MKKVDVSPQDRGTIFDINILYCLFIMIADSEHLEKLLPFPRKKGISGF